MTKGMKKLYLGIKIWNFYFLPDNRIFADVVYLQVCSGDGNDLANDWLHILWKVNFFSRIDYKSQNEWIKHTFGKCIETTCVKSTLAYSSHSVTKSATRVALFRAGERANAFPFPGCRSYSNDKRDVASNGRWPATYLRDVHTLSMLTESLDTREAHMHAYTYTHSDVYQCSLHGSSFVHIRHT